MRKSGSPDYAAEPTWRMPFRLEQPTPDPNAKPKTYTRRQLSNYEGYKRLDKSLEKIANEKSGRDVLCDVCGRRCRATRIVPAVFGHKGVAGGPFAGRKFVVACDHGPDGCAARLTRAGVHKAAVAEADAMERLGLVLP